jgi:hypothetical protein
MQCDWRTVFRSLTGRDQGESGSSVDNAGSLCENTSRGTVSDGLVDTPELVGRASCCKGTSCPVAGEHRNFGSRLSTHTYMYVMFPVYLLWSVPPNVNSPSLTDDVLVGSKDTETILDAIVPWLKRLSVIVGTVLFTAGDSVPMVRSTGPILQKRCQRKYI